MANRKLDKNSDSFRMTMIVTKAWLARVDIYAKRNRITRSQAIRILVDQSLAAMLAPSTSYSPHKRKPATLLPPAP